MIESNQRDKVNENWSSFLNQYYEKAKYDTESLVASAIRTKSLGLREVLVRGAFGSGTSMQDVKECLVGRQPEDSLRVVDPYLLGELGRVVLLQDLRDEDSSLGAKIIDWAHNLAGSGLSKKARRTLIQYYIVTREYDEATELLDTYEDLDSHYFGYLRAEMSNPFVAGKDGSQESWLSSFNRVFERHKLFPVELTSDETLRPFDRLSAPHQRYIEAASLDTPLVSVVLTAFQPDEDRLLTSVHSILEQTWQNFELIIVNDCSGTEFAGIFERLSRADSRIRVITLDKNQGTYAARNIGYAASHGVFITGQDDDDWSHPQRLERQIDFMLRNPDLIGCRVGAIRCSEDLERVRVGYHPYGQNASSLLVRREGHEAVGGFLEARKAADTEYYYRIMRATGRDIKDVKAPLSIIRILSDSLSRADFSPGWKHSSRRSFRSAYELWHRESAIEDLHISKWSRPKVAIPYRFQISHTEKQHYEVIYAGDWQGSNSKIRSMLAEIRALLRSNAKVAILHLESGRALRATDQVPLNKDIQRLINEGLVDEVFYDDKAFTKLLILSDPLVLSFLPYGASSITVDSMLVIANEAPYTADAAKIAYVPSEAHTNAKIAFKVHPLWLPRDQGVRATLSQEVGTESLHPKNWVGIVEAERTWHERIYFRSVTPVVGSHNFERGEKLSLRKSELEEAFPQSGQYDVRFLGEESTILTSLGLKQIPAAWTVYDSNRVDLLTFLRSLDYYIYFPTEASDELPIQEILAVMSSGLVVILPKGSEEIFGEAALYADHDEIETLINYFHADFSRYERQLDKSKTALRERFSPHSFQRLVSQLLKHSQYKDDAREDKR